MKAEFRLGVTLPAFNAVISQASGPIDLTGLTVKFRMIAQDNTVKVAETSSHVTIHPTQAFTLDTTNNWVYAAAHGYSTGNIWIPATTGSLSGTGLTAATRYVVVEKDVDWFRVSVRSSGNTVTIAGAGTGTHSGYVVGSMQYAWQAADVDTEGLYRAYVTAYSGNDFYAAPAGGVECEVQIRKFGW